MNAWLTYILVLIGAIYFVTGSALFAPVRMFAVPRSAFVSALLYCPACAGFWLGLGFGAAGLWPNVIRNPFEFLLSGLAAMGVGALWQEYGPPSPYSHELEQLGLPQPSADDTKESAP